MSTRPSKTNARAWLLCGVIAVFTFVIAAGGVGLGVYWFTRGSAQGSAQDSGEPSVSRKVKALERRLTPESPIAMREGVAVAILIDTSGSMKEDARDAQGAKRSKIEIARRAALDTVRRIEAFARANPDVIVELALYEFSVRRNSSARVIVPLGAPDSGRAERALAELRAKGDTPIGEAMIEAKHDLDLTGLARRHILVVTDGENTKGAKPGDVAEAIGRLEEDLRASLYVIAFDTDADHFDAVKEAGGLVLSAASGRELGETLEYVLSGKILVEAPLEGR